MGRTVFSLVWRMVNELKVRGGFAELYIYGTMGYGKSHILAVLAGLLSRSSKRTVYLPDCRRLVTDPIGYLQSALLCTFADPSSLHTRDDIRALKSFSNIINFCQQEILYFIIDQKNAFDESEDINMDINNNSKKNAVREFLCELTAPHYVITSASADHRTAMHMAEKQTGERKLSLMGGMSEVSKPSNYYFTFLSCIRNVGGDETLVVPPRRQSAYD